MKGFLLDENLPGGWGEGFTGRLLFWIAAAACALLGRVEPFPFCRLCGGVHLMTPLFYALWGKGSDGVQSVN